MNNSRIEKIAPLLAFAAVLTAGAPQGAAAQTPAPNADQFRKILKEMVETDSSVISGSCTAVADKIAAHMKANGFPAENITLLSPQNSPRPAISSPCCRAATRSSRPC